MRTRGRSEAEILAEIEMDRRNGLDRPYPSKATRARYRHARNACKIVQHYPARATFWAKISKKTTFQWKAETLGENCLALWKLYHDTRKLFPHDHRGSLMYKAISAIFGVDPDDIRADNRDAPISYPRSVACALLYRDGVTKASLKSIFNKNHKSVEHMIPRGEQILREFIDDKTAADWGFAFVDQPKGRISVRVPATADEDSAQEEARPHHHCGGFDGGEGSSSGDLGQQDH
jgi:hypothetical protein